MKEVRIYRILAALSALLAALADRAEQLKNAYLAGAVSGGAARRQAERLYTRFGVLCERTTDLAADTIELNAIQAKELNQHANRAVTALYWLLFNFEPKEDYRLV